MCDKPILPEMVIENARRMTAAAIERDCDPNMLTISHHENILHCFIGEYSRWIGRDGDLVCDEQLSELFSHLIAMGCELDGQDVTGKTALLVACKHKQYRIFKILAGKGADVSALDNQGDSALHLLLQWVQDLKGDEHEQLRDALIAALVGGCDPNGLSTSFALSPTDYSIATDIGWSSWTKALIDVGYVLLETAEIDELDEPHSTSTWVVVSGDYHDTLKLPVSNWTLDDWKAERSRIIQRKRLFERASDEDDNLSPASDVHEKITEWENDSDTSSLVG